MGELGWPTHRAEPAVHQGKQADMGCLPAHLEPKEEHHGAFIIQISGLAGHSMQLHALHGSCLHPGGPADLASDEPLKLKALASLHSLQTLF